MLSQRYPGDAAVLRGYRGDEAMKELIKHIAQAMVDHPEQVEVTEVAGVRTLVLELKVAKADRGYIIGKQGHNASAIRTILNAASAKTRKRVQLEILE
jgi:predicted RNA-binding protein YlqC (UPF0109 family)